MSVTTAPEILDEEENISPVQVFKRAYAFLYNKTVGVVLILAMAILVFFGTIIMQAPAGTFEDPANAEAWLESVRPKYGGWTPILSFIGFFRIYSSPLFLFVSALLAASIIACTTHRFPTLWKAAMHPRVHVSDNFHRHAQNRTAVEGFKNPTEAINQASAVLRKRRWRVIADPKDEHAAYADKNRFGPWGTALAHAAFVLIMLAFVLMNNFAVEHFLPIAVGDKTKVPGTSLTVEAEDFEDTYQDGRPVDYVSHLVVYDGEREAAEQDVRVNSPLKYGGFRFHQTSYGIAAKMTVNEENAYTVPLQWTSADGTNVIGRLEADELAGFEVLVVTPASGRADSQIPAGTAMIEVYPAGSRKPIAVEELPQGESVTVQGADVSFEREVQYTGITARHDPATIIMWIASVLLVVGMWMTFGFPHRRVWLRANGTELSLASVDKHDAIYEREFRGLVADISPTDLTTIEKEEKNA